MSFAIDFSPIGNLGKIYDEARTKSVRERTLAELGQHFANGDIDYRGLGAKLFALGEPRAAMSALQMGEVRDARALQMHAPGAPPQPALTPQLPARSRPGLPPQAQPLPRFVAQPLAQVMVPPAGLPLAPGVWRWPGQSDA
jgi:hypothetical protein